MNESTELLVLRLALIGVLFLLVASAATTMRSGLAMRTASIANRRVASGWRLVLIAPGDTGYEPGTQFPVAGVMVLGRDPDNGIVLGDASVSGQHAQIERTANGWRLTDLGSTNGTLVNGRSIDGRSVSLRGGEQVSLGSVVLRFDA